MIRWVMLEVDEEEAEAKRHGHGSLLLLLVTKQAAVVASRAMGKLLIWRLGFLVREREVGGVIVIVMVRIVSFVLFN